MKARVENEGYLRSHSVHERGRDMRITGELLGIKRLMKARIGVSYGE